MAIRSPFSSFSSSLFLDKVECAPLLLGPFSLSAKQSGFSPQSARVTMSVNDPSRVPPLFALSPSRYLPFCQSALPVFFFFLPRNTCALPLPPVVSDSAFPPYPSPPGRRNWQVDPLFGPAFSSFPGKVGSTAFPLLFLLSSSGSYRLHSGLADAFPSFSASQHATM